MDGEMDVELEKGEDFLSQEENDSWEIWETYSQTHEEMGIERVDHFIAQIWKNARILHEEYGMTCQTFTAPGKQSKTFDLSTRSWVTACFNVA